MTLIKKIFTISPILFSSFIYANNDIVGLWRSVDDKTGFSKGIVEIKKNERGIYTGKIIEVIPRPGYTPKTHCNKCPAPYTDQPVVGLQVLLNMRQDPKNYGEYEGGTILDPVSGKLYKSRIKLSADGKRLAMRGFVGVEVLGRTQYWIRHTP